MPIYGICETASMIPSQLASGRTIRDIFDDYPYFEEVDMIQTLQYAAWLAGRCEDW